MLGYLEDFFIAELGGLHIQLGKDGKERVQIQTDQKTKKMWAIMEEEAKDALAGYQKEHPQHCNDDPFYSYMLGKLDGRAAVETTRAFVMSEAEKLMLNPTYKFRSETTPTNGRMGLRRLMMRLLHRRATINDTLATLFEDKRAWAKLQGAHSRPPMFPPAEKKTKSSSSSGSAQERNAAPSASSAVVELTAMAALFAAKAMDNTLTPEAMAQALKGRSLASYRPAPLCIMLLSKLGTEYDVVAAVGQVHKRADDETEVRFVEYDGSPVLLYNRKKNVEGPGGAAMRPGQGMGGGKLSLPHIRFRANQTQQAAAFLEATKNAAAPGARG